MKIGVYSNNVSASKQNNDLTFGTSGFRRFGKYKGELLKNHQIKTVFSKLLAPNKYGQVIKESMNPDEAIEKFTKGRNFLISSNGSNAIAIKYRAKLAHARTIGTASTIEGAVENLVERIICKGINAMRKTNRRT